VQVQVLPPPPPPPPPPLSAAAVARTFIFYLGAAILQPTEAMRQQFPPPLIAQHFDA
jgi:hypothetical protein